MTNHTLEKPNNWWRLHLPLVISLKLTQIPITHPRYDTSPYHSSTSREMKAHERRHDGWSSNREASTGWRLHWGNLESLAFRGFNRILIFGHWLSKTLKLALASGAFFLKIAFTISQQTIFKIQKYFPKMFFKKIFQKPALRYFRMCEAFLLSKSMLYNFPSHVQTQGSKI